MVADSPHSARAFAHCSCRVIPRWWIPFLPKCTKWNERNNNTCSSISFDWPYHSSYSCSLPCTWCSHPYLLRMQRRPMPLHNTLHHINIKWFLTRSGGPNGIRQRYQHYIPNLGIKEAKPLYQHAFCRGGYGGVVVKP
jgi:hypothetical protein